MTLQSSSSQHFFVYTMFASRTRFTVRFTHVFYCVLCIRIYCNYNMFLLVTPAQFFSFFCWLGFWLLETTLRRALRNVALILIRVLLLLFWPRLVSTSNVINCLLFCVCVSAGEGVHVWRLFGLVGLVIRIGYHHSLPAACLFFWCYYSIIIISF